VPVFRVKGEKLIPARLLPSAGHRRQRSLSRLTRRWNRRRLAPRLSAQVVRRLSWGLGWEGTMRVAGSAWSS